MKLLKTTFLVQLECCLWVLLLAFATIGCSAKQTLFGAFDLAVEKPLTGSKAISSVGGVNCMMMTSSKQLKCSVSLKLNSLKITLPITASLGVGVFSTKKGELCKDYIFKLAGTDPPLYLMFQRMKIALLQ